MVEATTGLNYNNIVNNIKATTVTIPANITIESPNDFNAIAASCNTNVCFFCQKTFTNVYNCRRHIRTHSGEKPFACNVCGKKFSRQSTLNAHEKVHTGNQIFKCEVCGKAFDVYRHLTEHQIVHRQDKPFTCKICNKSYSRATVLSQHMKSHSNASDAGNIANDGLATATATSAATATSTVTTNDVESVDTTDTAAVAAITAVPTVIPTTVTITSSEQQQPMKTTMTTTVSVPVVSQPVYKCQQCETMFMTPSELKDHEQVHITQSKEDKKVVTLKEVIVMMKPDEPQVIQLMPQIKCYVCEEHFNTEQERANHAVVHNRIVITNDPPPSVQAIVNNGGNVPTVTTIEPPSLPVPALDIEMEAAADDDISYDDVIKLTLLDTKSPCNVCGKSHTKNQPCDRFKCDICDRRFSILSNFNAHKRIHKQNKPFRCSICGKSFRLAKSLTVHMVLHTETSFDCPVCDRSFNRSGSLKVHMRSHTTAELQAPKRSYIDVGICHDADDLFGDDEENRDVGFSLDFVDESPTFCDICGRQFTQCNANTRTHKCSKYPIDEDFDDEEEQLSSLDIWNCE